MPRQGNPQYLTPWKPGQTGNPNGRPRKNPISDALREILEENPEELKKLAKKAIQLAQNGSRAHLQEIADRIEGKPRQSIHHIGEFEHNIVSRDDVLRKLTELVERVSQRRKSAD